VKLGSISEENEIINLFLGSISEENKDDVDETVEESIDDEKIEEEMEDENDLEEQEEAMEVVEQVEIPIVDRIVSKNNYNFVFD